MRIANMTPTEQDKELREKMLSLYSANFNDGEPIESRVGSRDMFSVSVIVDFVDDFIVPFITADRKRVALEARIHEIGLMQHQARVNLKTSNAVAEWGDIRIAELRAQQEEL